MYSGAWRKLGNFVFLDWPRGFEGHSVRELAEVIVTENRINAEDAIVGSSLGGIVACEISNLLTLRQVVLIGSATRKEEISSLLVVMHPLVDYAPLEFLKRLSGTVPVEFLQMFSEAEAVFMRKMCRAIFRWGGFNGRSSILRIHGKKDRVIPLPGDADVVIDGGHLIAMTHPSECIDAVLR